MNTNIETNPTQIELKSFQIIESLVDLSTFSDLVKPVIKRIIHTTGDIEFAKLSHANEKSVIKGMQAISHGCHIITDVSMVSSGINQTRLSPFKCDVLTAIKNKEVEQLAEQKNITRAMAAADFLSPMMNQAIILCGNAPTFLYRVMELLDQGIIQPALIVAFPVGFVGAAESKEKLLTYKDKVAIITNEGNKGGSAICAAVLNALVLNLINKIH